jgi:hypothetical protein
MVSLSVVDIYCVDVVARFFAIPHSQAIKHTEVQRTYPFSANMQFTNLAALFFSAITLTSAAALPTLITADTIVQDIQNIHSGVLANQAATEAYEGGDVATTLIQGTPVYLADAKGPTQP